MAKKGQVNKPGQVPGVLKSADERSPVATGLRREEEKQREVRALEAAVAGARAAACADLTCAAVSSLHEELSAAKYREVVAQRSDEQLTGTRAYFQLFEKRRVAKQAAVTKLQEEVILLISNIDETKAQIAKLEETAGTPAQGKQCG